MVLLSKIVIPIGVVISLASAMIILSTIGDPNAIGPSMAIVILSLFYSFLIKIVVEVMIAKER